MDKNRDNVLPTVGIPGRFGSSWIMLQALLGSADLTPDDVELRELVFALTNDTDEQIEATEVRALAAEWDAKYPLFGAGSAAGRRLNLVEADARTRP